MSVKARGRDRLSATHFLSVDLDIYSQRDLQPLVKALGRTGAKEMVCTS